MKYREAARKLQELGCQELPRRKPGSHRKKAAKVFTPDGFSCAVDLASPQQCIRVTGREPERTMARLKVWWEARDSARQDVESPVRTGNPLP